MGSRTRGGVRWRVGFWLHHNVDAGLRRSQPVLSPSAAHHRVRRRAACACLKHSGEYCGGGQETRHSCRGRIFAVAADAAVHRRGNAPAIRAAEGRRCARHPGG